MANTDIPSLPLSNSSVLLSLLTIDPLQITNICQRIKLRLLDENNKTSQLNDEEESSLWNYLLNICSAIDKRFLGEVMDFIYSPKNQTNTSPQDDDPQNLLISCAILLLEIFLQNYHHRHRNIHERITSQSQLLLAVAKSLLPILFKASSRSDFSSELGNQPTIGQILFHNGRILLQDILIHSKSLICDLFADQTLLNDIFSLPNSSRVDLTLTLLSPSCLLYPPLSFTNNIINGLLKNRVLEKLLSHLGTITNGSEGSKVLEIIAIVTSCCLSTGDTNLEPYTTINTANREDILSTICAFEVNGFLLNTAKSCCQLPLLEQEETFSRTMNSLIYLSLCKEPTICYSKISETMNYMTSSNLENILADYDYLKNTLKRDLRNPSNMEEKEANEAKEGFRECTEVVQVFIDLIPRIMGLRSNTKRKSQTGEFSKTSRKYLVSSLRILSTFTAGHLEVRGRPLAKRLPLGSIAYSSLDDFEVVLYDEFCRSMAVAVFASHSSRNTHNTAGTSAIAGGPSGGANEGGKHLEPQLIHVCMHSGSILSRHPELAPSYLMLASSILLTKDPHKLRLLFDAKILDFCLVILTTPSLSHSHAHSHALPNNNNEQKKYSQLCYVTFQFLTTLIICCPSVISTLVLDPRFQVFLFNSFSQFFTSEHVSMQDFCCLIQFWVTYLIAADVFLYSSSLKQQQQQQQQNQQLAAAGGGGGPGIDEERIQNEHKTTESLVHLVWILFSALSSYPKKSSFGSITNNDCYFILTIRLLRVVLSRLESRSPNWSAQHLKKSICSSATTIRNWLEISPELVENSDLFDNFILTPVWLQPPVGQRENVKFANAEDFEIFLNTMSSLFLFGETYELTSFQSPSWIRSMPLSILFGNVIEFIFQLFHFSLVTNCCKDAEFPLIKVTGREIIQLSLCFCSSSPTLPCLSEASNLETFLSQNSQFLFDIDWQTQPDSSLLTSKLEWYQLVYESCVVAGSKIPCPEFFHRWVELAIISITQELNRGENSRNGEENLCRWTKKLCGILEQVADWAHEDDSTALQLAYSGLSLTLLHAHIQFFVTANQHLHEVLFPEELGNIANQVSDNLLNAISCLCGCYISNDEFCCILDIMNSTVTFPIETGPNLSSESQLSRQPTLEHQQDYQNRSPRASLEDQLRKSSNYYGSNAEMIRKWGYSVILASPHQMNELHRTERTKSFVARMKSLELPSGLHSPRKIHRDHHHKVQLRDHLSSPAWCRIQATTNSRKSDSHSIVIAKEILVENNDSTEDHSENIDSSVPSWIPMSFGYTISVWFSIRGDSFPSLSGGSSCSSQCRCQSGIHYVLCRISGTESSLWPTYYLYICDGRVLVNVENSDTLVLFEPLLQINYDGRWHHLVIRHHTNRQSRPFIMATLDGLPSQEYVLQITPKNKSSKKRHRKYSVSSYISIPNDHPPTRSSLSLGPLMIIRKPLNTAQVIALHGAGPHYTGVFTKIMTQLPLGEGGEIPLNLSYCSNVLAEATLKANSSMKYKLPTKTHTNRFRSLNSLPGVLIGNIFTDPELSSENVMYAASSKWIPPSHYHNHHHHHQSVCSSISKDQAPHTSFHLTGCEMFSDVTSFFSILQSVKQNANNLKDISSSSHCFVYSPRSDDSHPTSLTCSGDVLITIDPRPSLTDNASSIINVDFFFRSALRLLLTTSVSQEVEYSIRLFDNIPKHLT